MKSAKSLTWALHYFSHLSSLLFLTLSWRFFFFFFLWLYCFSSGFLNVYNTHGCLVSRFCKKKKSFKFTAYFTVFIRGIKIAVQILGWLILGTKKGKTYTYHWVLIKVSPLSLSACSLSLSTVSNIKHTHNSHAMCDAVRQKLCDPLH